MLLETPAGLIACCIGFLRPAGLDGQLTLPGPACCWRLLRLVVSVSLFFMFSFLVLSSHYCCHSAATIAVASAPRLEAAPRCGFGEHAVSCSSQCFLQRCLYTSILLGMQPVASHKFYSGPCASILCSTGPLSRPLPGALASCSLCPTV